LYSIIHIQPKNYILRGQKQIILLKVLLPNTHSAFFFIGRYAMDED